MSLTSPTARIPDPRLVGERIAHARRVAGMKQLVLAGRLGIAVRTLQNYESGRRIPWDSLDQIAALTGRTKGWFLSDPDSTGLDAIGDDLSVIVTRLDAIEKSLHALHDRIMTDILQLLLRSQGAELNQPPPEG
jgi:transcriptional regulator with XRE-family HTH domain